MFVSGVVATASLVGILVALFGAAVLLAYIDNSFDKNRQH
jgi:type III secretory pathway component EscS